MHSFLCNVSKLVLIERYYIPIINENANFIGDGYLYFCGEVKDDGNHFNMSHDWIKCNLSFCNGIRFL
jgi:hypothetical protein